MKKGFLLVALISFLTTFSAIAQDYKVDTQKSNIEWTGRKVGGAHSGNLKLQSGALKYNNGLKGGTFTIDMNSIQVTDITGEYATKLEGHLKNDDFFATDKFPAAKFTITKIAKGSKTAATVTGNLTIKGKTNTVTFPVTLAESNGVLTAQAKGVKVDRSKYDVKYGSKSFFDSLGDKAIDDEFELNISLVAKK